MIILLYGQDNYRLRKKLRDIIKKAKEKNKGKLYLKRFGLKDFSLEKFRSEYQSTSLFGEEKFLVLENFSSSNILREVLSFLKKQKSSKNIVAFWEEITLEKSNLLLKFIKENGISFRFDPLQGNQLIEWIEKEFRKYKINIDSRIALTLAEFFGNDLWLLSNEIKKLVLLFGSKKRILPQDIRHLVRPKLETDIFETIEAISSQNKDRALKLLCEHIKQGDSPFYILSMLKSQIANLLITKELIQKGIPLRIISSKMRLPVFVVRKHSSLSYRFTLENLRKAYWKIFQYEIKIKTGKIDPVLALELLTIEI